MARSGERARALKRLLGRVGDVPTRPTLPRPGRSELALASLDETVVETYVRLGRVRVQPRVAPGPWDLQLGNVAIELDEENHFNRYRGTTLEADAYQRIVCFDQAAYRSWCASEEAACLIYGQYWTNDSCEREFGPAGRRGDLSGRGAPRWKQRAFYDFIKDLAPECLEISVARLSIYEAITCGNDTAPLGDVLYRTLDGSEANEWAYAVADRIRTLASPKA